MDLIDEGQVVPIVGKDLLRLSEADGGGHLYPYLAARLAAALGVAAGEMTPGDELNDVVCHYLNNGTDHPENKIYSALKRAVSEAETFDIPEPLLQLAAITPLKLFVTTTFDSNLARAINHAQFGDNARATVHSYSPGRKEDIPAPEARSGVPIIYHLLGKASVTPSYAVTQWDVVEFFYALLSETRRPPLLFDELKSKSMLVLGSHFGSWLVRFFMRMAKGQPGSVAMTADIIADTEATGDSTLALFVRRVSRDAVIYRSGNASEFVAELHRRWMQRHPDSGALSDVPVRPLSQSAPGGVFLSYASDDFTAAEKIKNSLEAAGIDVFFDKDDLRAGENWEAKLRRKIDECSLFIPVISRNTLTPARRFFRIEWNLALKQAEMTGFSEQDTFLLPVAIDDTAATEAGLPDRFRTIQWTRLPAGDTTTEFVSRVQLLFRQYQKSIGAGAR